jgi:hypothetical protein
MPLQNRVMPSGEIISDPSRAARFMGNRGILHDDERRLCRALEAPRLDRLRPIVQRPKARVDGARILHRAFLP